MRIRRVASFLILIALAVGLVFVLRERRRQFIAAQVRILQSEDSVAATQARKRLQRIGRSAVRPVCALLQHENEQVRARAALCLANIGHPAACGPLMEAAKRGEFPAADALAFMKHPRGAETRARLYCQLGDKALEDLQRRLPNGGGTPTELWIWLRPPTRPFRGPTRAGNRWPYWGHAPAWLESQPADISRLYRQALEKVELPEALIGQARLLTVCGDYAEAAEMYARALELAPASREPRTGLAEADRLVRLNEDMRAASGARRDFRAILTHPSWREGDATYYVASTTEQPSAATVRYLMPNFTLFRSSRQGVEQVGEIVPGFTKQERTAAGQPLRAHASTVAPAPGQSALLVVIRGLAPWQRSNDAHDVVLYRPSPSGLVKVLQAPSADMPWVGDLDADGDVEIVTWRELTRSCDVWWPVVRTWEDGHWRVRTEQFPSVFPDVVQRVAKSEPAFPLDPKLPDYLGRGREILGQPDGAMAAYRSAARKYEDTAEGMADKGHTGQARLHRKAAAAVRERLRRLEAQEGSG